MKDIKVFAKVALSREYHFVAMVEESGKFIEDSIDVAKKYFDDNPDLPIYGFIFVNFITFNKQPVVFDCNEKFEYLGI